MNIKNLPLFTVSEICYDTILSYFLNNYVSGSKIPIICKGKYLAFLLILFIIKFRVRLLF